MPEGHDEMDPHVYTDKGTAYNYDIHKAGKRFLDFYFSLPPVTEFRSLIEGMGPSPRVLDLGSGKGLESKRLRQLLPNVQLTSIDISQTGSRIGRKKFKLDQVQGDITQPPFADGSFEAIHCKDVLVHIKDKRPFLEDVSRLCQ